MSSDQLIPIPKGCSNLNLFATLVFLPIVLTRMSQPTPTGGYTTTLLGFGARQNDAIALMISLMTIVVAESGRDGPGHRHYDSKAEQSTSNAQVFETRFFTNSEGNLEKFCLVAASTHETEYNDYLRFRKEGYRVKVEPKWLKIGSKWVSNVQWAESWVPARCLTFLVE